MLNRGDVVDRYKVEDLLGKGGMASVYLVRHRKLNSLHALKLLFLKGASIRKRLVREGRVQASLRHHNVVSVTDVLEVDGSPALVMEYIDGPALDEWMVGRALSIEEALYIFRGVVLAIGHAHRLGVAHRDLKPANILLADTNDGMIPKVTDFGLVKALHGDDGRARTKAGVDMGTPNYMSPEQIVDAASVDKRTDIFSLGCILYELVSGVEAFSAENHFDVYAHIMTGEYMPLPERVPDVPRRVARAVEMCLRVDREERLTDCEMLFDMLYDKQNVTVTADGPNRVELLMLKSLNESIASFSDTKGEPARVPQPKGRPVKDGRAILSRVQLAVTIGAATFCAVFLASMLAVAFLGDQLVADYPAPPPAELSSPTATAPPGLEGQRRE